MAHGSKNPRGRHGGGRWVGWGGVGERRPGGPLEPLAMSHEPFTIKKINNEVFDYILWVFDFPKKTFHGFQEGIGPISMVFDSLFNQFALFVGARLL